MGNFTAQSSDANFDADVIKSDTTVLVDFWAEWCGPCRALAPKLEEIGEEMQGQLKIIKINVDENPESPAKFGVRGIPTMIVFKDGEEKEQIVGNFPKEQIVDVVKKYI